MSFMKSIGCSNCGKKFDVVVQPAYSEGWEGAYCSRQCQLDHLKIVAQELALDQGFMRALREHYTGLDIETAKRAPATAEMTEIVLPGDTNHLGTAFGGKIMQWIDICAAIAAQRHAGGTVVTASIDGLEFRKPIRQGDIVTLKARVNASWNTSMEIGVKVEVESPATKEHFQACRAYLTFVALDSEGQRRAVQEVAKVVDVDWRRFKEAQIRRKARLAMREEIEK